MKFCPTGGIDARLAKDYLQLSNVLAVGGSWMAPEELIIHNRYSEISELAAYASRLV
jgi:2-dehydro-3-deoxyphosphogluconate aldolase/(4S)-4-hydroxy-2-oxoglutarate aldolase